MTLPSGHDMLEGGYWTANGKWIPPVWNTVEKPRLDWLLLTVLTLDLGVWVGLLAWWIWR